MHLVDGYNYYVKPVIAEWSVYVIPLTFGRARINLGTPDFYLEGW